jgi:prophage antirepressor-like protein
MTSNILDLPQPLAVRRTFHDHPVIAVSVGEDVFFVVGEVEAAIGYSPKALSNGLGRWQEHGQIREEVHVRKLFGAELARFKGAAGDLVTIDPRTPNLLVLTKRGLYRVLMLSRQPKAVAFQDWLETEVLPSIEQTGRYALPAAPPAPPPRPPGGRGAPPSASDAPEGRPRQRRLTGREVELPSFAILINTDWREHAVHALDSGQVPVRSLATVRDHLLGRARTAVRGITGPARTALLEHTAVELAALFNLRLPTFEASQERPDRVALARALFVVESVSDAQLARLLPFVSARREQALLVNWTGLAEVGWTLSLPTRGAA